MNSLDGGVDLATAEGAVRVPHIGLALKTAVAVNADEEDRIKRIAEVQNITKDKAKDLMIKIDKKRSSYYNYYSNKHWSDSKSYDLCINSSKLGLDGCVKLLKSYIGIKEESGQ